MKRSQEKINWSDILGPHNFSLDMNSRIFHKQCFLNKLPMVFFLWKKNNKLFYLTKFFFRIVSDGGILPELIINCRYLHFKIFNILRHKVFGVFLGEVMFCVDILKGDGVFVFRLNNISTK